MKLKFVTPAEENTVTGTLPVVPICTTVEPTSICRQSSTATLNVIAPRADGVPSSVAQTVMVEIVSP